MAIGLRHLRRPLAGWSLLLLVILVAVGLRLVGLRYGLPAVYNPDEAAIMSRALAFAKGDLNPHNFLYPTLFFYVLFGWIGVFFVGARLIGAVSSLGAFEALFFTDPSSIYLAGRLLTVACGVGTVVLVYVFGSRLFGRATGLIAAAFLAVAPFHVRDSHYVKHDVPVTLAIVAAQIAIAKIWPLFGKNRDFLDRRHELIVLAAAGFACGVAFSTHYYAIFLTVPLTLGVLARFASRGVFFTIGKLGVALASSLIAFFLCSPFILADPRIAWRDIVANRQIVVDRALGGGAFANLGNYLQMLWLDAAGWPVIVLAGVGIGWMLARSPWRAWLLLGFPVAFLLFISNTVAASRYLEPVLPSVALFAAYTVVRVSAGGARAPRHAMAAALALLAAVPGLAQSVRSDLFFRQTDTRTLAQRYIEAEIRPGSSILVQPYSVPLRQSRDSLVEALTANVGSADKAPTKFALQLALHPYPSPAYRLLFLGDGGLDVDKIYVSYGELGGPRGLTALVTRGVQYVIVKRYNVPEPSTRPFLEALTRDALRLEVFSPYRPGAGPESTAGVEPYLHNTDARIQEPLERPGPVVEIWRLNDAHP